MIKRRAVNRLLSVFTAATMIVQGFCTPITVNAVNIRPTIAAPDGSNIALSSSVTYDGTNYVLNIGLSGNHAQQTYTDVLPFTAQALVNATSGSSSYTIPETGWYAIQVHGGSGGNGGTARTYEDDSYTEIHTHLGSEAVGVGGTGAAGYYTVVYKHFDANQTVSYTVGTNGSSAPDTRTVYSSKVFGTKEKAYANGGTRGTFSSVSVDGTGVIIAGGGGGGGGGAAGDDSSKGKSASSTYSKADSFADATASGRMSQWPYSNYNHDSSDGEKASGAVTATGGDAGSNGYYFIDSAYSTSTSTLSGQGDALANAQSLSSLSSAGVVITCLETDAHMNAGSPGTIEDMKNTMAASLQGFSISTGISNYFTVTDVSIDGSLSYSMSGNTLNITGINPGITFTGDTDPSSSDSIGNHYTIDATGNANIQVKLQPKEGFLGGNDVPLTTSAVTLTKGTSTDTAGGAANVNVPIPDVSLSVKDIHIVSGSSTTKGAMVTSMTSKPSESWKYDYVDFTATDLTTNIAPAVTTDYDFSVSIAPKTVTPTSTIGTTAVTKSASDTATCYVDYSVTYSFTNMTSKSSETTDATSDFSTTIAPATDYLLPDSIAITVGGTALATDKYTYNNATGAVTIPKTNITGNIVITASGKVPSYVLTYIYQVPQGSGFVFDEHEETYERGATIDLDFYNNFVPAPVKGFVFSWNWGTTGNEPLTTMPGSNWTVNGSYAPDTYKLTVEYVYVGGATAYETHEENVVFGDTYSVASPSITGYTADISTVAGAMEDEGKTITVTYTPNKYTLTVNYVYEDDSIAATTYTEQVDYNGSYSVTSPTIQGYVPSIATVSGTMNSVDGLTVKVTYTKKALTLTIKYVDKDNGDVQMINPETGEPVEDVVKNIKLGDTYSVTSPVLKNHSCDREVVSGTMGASDLTVYVYYTDDIISVKVEWGDMEFDLTRDDDWDPSNHSYGNGSLTAAPAAAGANYIKVTNNSSIGVDIDLSYTPIEGFGTINGWFTGSNDSSATAVTDFSLGKGSVNSTANTVYLWLSGSLGASEVETFICGKVTVLISSQN